MSADQTMQKFVGALQIEIRKRTDALCDYPQKEPFEHGVQVGTCQGLKLALNLLESVVEDIAEEEARR